MTPCRAAISLLLLAALVASPDGPARAADVRVLIDVSGSMRKTDPENLRIPALKLLAELLPAGTTAGVWLFDQETDELLKPATVDAAWKDLARGRAYRIHSRGQFTNIEAAIEAASAGWVAAPVPSGMERHLVLLTDGVIDVGKDPATSAESRTRVLGTLLRQLKEKSVRVHTVALSDEVDRELLAALSDATGGWREQAPTASALQRAFLHMFEQASPPDTVPLKGTRFSIDGSVRELTLLVFRASDAPPLTVTAPTGQTLSAAAPGEHSRWDVADGYDLVTVESPVAGEWTFSGTEDPDNRAIVVTDLSLTVDELPSSALQGETLELDAVLLEAGKPIEREDFLAVTRADAALVGPGGNGDLFDLSLDPVTRRFRGALAAALPAGDYELTVRANGGTFQREVRRRLRIDDDPATILARVDGDPAAPRIGVALEVKTNLVDQDSVTGYVVATGPDGIGVAREIPPLERGAAVLALPITHGGAYTVAATLVAASASGRSVRLQVPPVSLQVGAVPAPAVAAPAAPTAGVGYGQAAALVGAGNLCLGAVLGPLWYSLRRRPLPSKGLSV